jgi:hypothetical protein
MERQEELSYERIVETVRGWSPSQRFHLIQEVLQTLAPQESRPRKRTLEKALGIAATNSPPNDEEVQRILEESLMEKYR